MIPVFFVVIGLPVFAFLIYVLVQFHSEETSKGGLGTSPEKMGSVNNVAPKKFYFGRRTHRNLRGIGDDARAKRLSSKIAG